MHKKIGLYFGTFNPIHVGHLIIANHTVNYTNLDQVWLVVSPQNPLKKKSSLLEDYHRLALVKVAIEDNPDLSVSDIEFSMPKPSYTANTLAYLEEKHPNYEFALIMGEDNLRTFHKWRNYEHIINKHNIYVYPRVLTEGEEKNNSTLPEIANHKNITKVDAPIMKISSSFIRNSIQKGKSVTYLLTSSVRKYIEEMHFYK